MVRISHKAAFPETANKEAATRAKVEVLAGQTLGTMMTPWRG